MPVYSHPYMKLIVTSGRVGIGVAEVGTEGEGGGKGPPFCIYRNWE